jgi:hypothetical protein
MDVSTLDAIIASFAAGTLVPYFGPGVLSLCETPSLLPADTAQLAARLVARSPVPHKLRGNLSGAAQFIENFKHRKTVNAAVTEAFRVDAEPTSLHRIFLCHSPVRLAVHAWYDDLPQRAMAARDDWYMAQGVSQAEHRDGWVHFFDRKGARLDASSLPAPDSPTLLLYQPLGSVWPERNYLVSDSDFVEVLTEIDIQTPIPEPVQQLRAGRNFLFLGCRFLSQLERQFARQIMKRSSETHWALLPEELSRNEARFLGEHNIARIEMRLTDFVQAMESQRTTC